MLFENFKIFSDTITVYLFDLMNFIKYLKSDNYPIKSLQIIQPETKKLQNFSEELLTKKTPPDSQLLKQITESFDLILSELKVLKCADERLNEKSDLLVRTFIIREQCRKLLSSNNIS